MADAVQYPKLSELAIFQWSRPDAPRPALADGLEADITDTTVVFTSAPKDEDGVIITAAFLMECRNIAGYTEVIYVPAGALSADGLTATNVVRGINPTGLDFTTANANFVAAHEVGSVVFCGPSATQFSILTNALQGIGDMATGGNGIVIGDATATDATISASLDDGVTGFSRLNATTGKKQWKNKTGAWVNNEDTADGLTVKVSANDTTAGYLNGKLVAGDNVTITEGNDGADETLTIAANSQREGIVEHETYTPGFLTGGSNAETNIALWDSVSDGSFRITIDGTAYNIDGLDFTDPIVTDMDDVAAVIEAGIRAATSALETCVWSTDHFIISSVNTTATSAVTVTTTSTGTVGTDISGAGASDWMDCDTGNGVVTAPVINRAADSGKVGLLGTDGYLDEAVLGRVTDPAGYAGKGAMPVATGANEGAVLEAGNNDQIVAYDSTEAKGVKQVQRARYLVVNDTKVSATLDNVENTLITQSVPGNALGTSNIIKVTLHNVNWDKGSSNLGDGILRGKYDGSAFVTVTYDHDNNEDMNYGDVVLYLIADGATDEQAGKAQTRVTNVVSADPGKDSTGALDLTVTFQCPSGTSRVFSFTGYTIEIIPA
jgi:hypothetical protein